VVITNGRDRPLNIRGDKTVTNAAATCVSALKPERIS
jgi:hypothetical protein